MLSELSDYFVSEAVLLLLAPVFVICILTELYYSYKHNKGWYTFKGLITNGNLATSFKLIEIVGTYFVIRIFYDAVYESGIKAMPAGIIGGILCFLFQDFLYYWFHRLSHSVAWLWSSHVTHHSSQEMNLSVALRQNFMYLVSGMWFFWLPLAWLGFDKHWIIITVELSLGYQFFVHTEFGRDWGRFGKVFNTPLFHRIHHSRNPELIDKNFAGVLIIWDKLFGTYQPDEEGQKLEYGIRRQVPDNKYHNLLTLTMDEWKRMIGNAWELKDARVLFKHPEWPYEQKLIKHPDYDENGKLIR